MAIVDPNGHQVRARRTREAIVDALLGLLDEGVVEPSASQIAERAGVSKRSLYVHFASLEDLYRELADRATAMVLERVRAIDPAASLPERIAELARQRADVHEAVGALRRAATRRAATSEVAAASQRVAREASRAQLARVFAAELSALPAHEGDRRLAVLDALVAGETWDLWRSSVDEDVAEQILCDALALVLAR